MKAVALLLMASLFASGCTVAEFTPNVNLIWKA